jgi:hypothetical protein
MSVRRRSPRKSPSEFASCVLDLDSQAAEDGSGVRAAVSGRFERGLM